MRLTLPAWIGAVAAVVLALGALLAVYYARRSVREQSRILGTLQQEAEAHAQLLRLQSSQLEAQRGQFREQRRVNERQADLLELQAAELRAALDERARAAQRERQAQASRVAAWIGAGGELGAGRGALIRNDSDLPVRAVDVSFYTPGDTDASGSEPWEPDQEPGRPAAAPWRAAAAAPAAIRVIRPRTTAFVPAPAAFASPAAEHDAAAAGEDYAAGVEFTDAAGLRWRRDADGALTER